MNSEQENANESRMTFTRWVAAVLGLTLTLGGLLHAMSRPISHDEDLEMAALFLLAASFEDEGVEAPATRAIEDIRVGDRVYVDNPTDEINLEFGLDIEPSEWRQLVLRAPKADGSWADVTLLRPAFWVEESKAAPGGKLHIDAPECGISGFADVLAIEPCPPIKPGAGRIVTGTYHHQSAHIVDVHVDGLAEPIGTTANHPFWSQTESKFVRADRLRPGELLRGTAGDMRVKSVHPRGTLLPVYNLEVLGDHMFHVSDAGVLVHNVRGFIFKCANYSKEQFKQIFDNLTDAQIQWLTRAERAYILRKLRNGGKKHEWFMVAAWERWRKMGVKYDDIVDAADNITLLNTKHAVGWKHGAELSTTKHNELFELAERAGNDVNEYRKLLKEWGETNLTDVGELKGFLRAIGE